MNNGKWRRQYWGSMFPEPIWFLYTDSGAGSDVFDDGNRIRMHCDDDYVYLGDTGGVAASGSYDVFLTKIDMHGSLVWEKVFGSTLGGDHIPHALDEWFGLNPNVAGEIALVNVIDDSGTDRWRLYTSDEDGDVGLSIDAGLSGSTFNDRPFSGMRVCSNGDVWAVSVTTGNKTGIQLFDRSASFLSTVTETYVDTFGDTTGLGVWELKTAILSDDSLIVMGFTVDTPSRMALLKVTTAGVCTAVDFYALNDTDDDATSSATLCVDSSDNIYLVWTQADDSEATSTDYLSKFNSSLSHQWTVSVNPMDADGDPMLSSKMGLCVSPDGSRVYLAANQYGMGGVLVDDTKVVAISTADGSKLSEWDFDGTNRSGSQDIIGPCTIACNSTSVFVGMNWQNSSGNCVGYGLLKAPQYIFDRGYILISKFFKSPKTAVTVASATAPTVTAKSVTKTTLSTSQSSITDIESGATDTMTRDFTKKWLFIQALY